MEISKIKDSYNMYKMELSFGELMAVKNALEQSHNEPVSDELRNGIEWYLNGAGDLPKPGEDEDARDEEGDLTGDTSTKAEPLPEPPSGEEEEEDAIAFGELGAAEEEEAEEDFDAADDDDEEEAFEDDDELGLPEPPAE